ncbi:MAG TPA: ABC transporter permease [Chitinispirillaceae bacterium]|nr:ABC transporter permease [Chitinispirillaceae bacterium]
MNRKVFRAVQMTGENVVFWINEPVASIKLLFRSLAACCTPSKTAFTSIRAQLSRQILYTGVEALWLVGIIAFLCGVVIVIQAMTNMPRFGVTEYFGNILIVSVVRELGPFFTALVIIGRSGAALAAHIGTMQVNKEVAALEVMGVDPVRFLVVPALAGMTLSLVCLNVYFDIVAIIGGLAFAKLTVVMPFRIFLEKVIQALTWKDILISVSKGVFFGMVVAVISCHYGLAVRNIRGVPQAAINAVVGSMAFTVVVSILVTLSFYAG